MIHVKIINTKIVDIICGWDDRKEIIDLDVEKIDFDDKEQLKRLILLLLNRIELLAQKPARVSKSAIER